MKGLDSNFIVRWDYRGLTANILSEAKTRPLKLILFVCFRMRITGGLVQIITRFSLWKWSGHVLRVDIFKMIPTGRKVRVGMEGHSGGMDCPEFWWSARVPLCVCVCVCESLVFGGHLCILKAAKCTGSSSSSSIAQVKFASWAEQFLELKSLKKSQQITGRVSCFLHGSVLLFTDLAKGTEKHKLSCCFGLFFSISCAIVLMFNQNRGIGREIVFPSTTRGKNESCVAHNYHILRHRHLCMSRKSWLALLLLLAGFRLETTLRVKSDPTLY